MTDLRQLLREPPVFAGALPTFDPADTPDDPTEPAREPGPVAPGWTLHTVRAEAVEFRQGDTDLKHTRPAHRRAGEHWTKELLWP
ncbi:pyridoxine 5'-phosphate oxidase C-terminal domain-containing protein [Streptomyces sp. NPDC048506]|uniref:pyridoxine 5'-phosphate oxidase C-terminal domain-containing protein n=1 Tax=Streptomyces sp. NPDC048506 TaxID=3155028 RepID=UPI0034204237